MKTKTVYVVQVANGTTQWVDYSIHTKRNSAKRTSSLIRPSRIIKRTEEVVE